MDVWNTIVSSWDELSSGALLVLGSVNFQVGGTIPVKLCDHFYPDVPKNSFRLTSLSCKKIQRIYIFPQENAALKKKTITLHGMKKKINKILQNIQINTQLLNLVGEFNPFEKYQSK